MKKRQTPTLLSTLGIPRVRRTKQTDCQVFVSYVAVFPVLSVEKNDFLPFRPNPENKNNHGTCSIIHSLLVNTVRKIINMNIYLHCTLIFNTITGLFSFVQVVFDLCFNIVCSGSCDMRISKIAENYIP